MRPRRLRRIDAAIAAALAGGTTTLLVGTAPAIGYARDEGIYFVAADAYGRWFRELAARPAEAVGRAAVDLHWSVNHEHPPLLKALFALSHEAFGAALGVEGTSYRLPAIVLAAALVALVFAWGTQVAGRAAGLVAAGSLLAMPRVFFHAHLACFDVPVTALFTATTYAWWRAFGARAARGAGWPAACALLFGATLAAKHNAWFLPFLFSAHTLTRVAAARASRSPAWPAARRPLAVLALALVVGPLVPGRAGRGSGATPPSGWPSTSPSTCTTSSTTWSSSARRTGGHRFRARTRR
jgi:4-amino-4-deoxy-L-arabinose transferase-like glycosyltransferase